jgi:hypothetical protein
VSKEGEKCGGEYKDHTHERVLAFKTPVTADNEFVDDAEEITVALKSLTDKLAEFKIDGVVFTRLENDMGQTNSDIR